MAVEDEFVEVSGLLGSEPVQSEVFEDEQVGGQERPKGADCRVIDSGLGQGLEEIVDVDEADSMSGADGQVAQGLSQETLADARGSYQRHVLVLVEKLQGEYGVRQTRGGVNSLDSSGGQSPGRHGRRGIVGSFDWVLRFLRA